MILSDTNHEIVLARDTGVRLMNINEAYRFEYIRKVNDVGAFEIMLPGDFDAPMLEAGYDRRIEFWRKPPAGNMQREFLGFVKKTRWQTDANGFTTLTVSGPGVNDLLARRYVLVYTTMTRVQKNDYADDMMKLVVFQNMGGGVGVATGRAISTSYFTVGPLQSLGPVVSLEFPWQNQLDTLLDIAAAARGAGTSVYFDIVPTTSAALQFQTFINQRGTDRRRRYHARPVVFSQEMGNLEMPQLEIDYTDEKSTFYVTGVGTGLQQNFVGWGDATRQTRSIFAWNEGYFPSQADTGAKLNDIGRAKLDEANVRYRFTGLLKDTAESQYGYHWFFGDRVSIDAFGIQTSAMVDMVRIAMNEDGVETLEASVSQEA